MERLKADFVQFCCAILRKETLHLAMDMLKKTEAEHLKHAKDFFLL